MLPGRRGRSPRSLILVGYATLLAVCAVVLPVARVVVPSAQTPAIGGTLPPWTRGTLDFHQISTGRGNAALVVFPDGTTLLVDAGAAGGTQPIPDTEPRPNGTRTPGAWIADYLQSVGVTRLDYVLLTHFHVDHIGGIGDVGSRIPIATMIDRGDEYLRPPDDDPTFKTYRTFLDAQARSGMTREPIRVGRADQVVLRRDRGAFPAVETRNVAANGDVWTGHGDEVTHVFPPLASLSADDRPSENMCSIGIRVRYGRFDLFTGGDMPGVPDAGAPAWQSVESAVARAVGPTDVHVANHHGSIDPESELFLTTLRSAVIILPSWSPTHPSQDALKRMMASRLYPGPRDIFATLLRAPTRTSIGSRADGLKADHGHIVVRVSAGGDSYRVYVLDDASEARTVLGVFGPYQTT
jgi:beta-lactamase superfamily II metal-dependent hydrolase